MLTGLLNLFKGKLATLLDKLKISSPIAYLGILIVVFGIAAVPEASPEVAEKFPWLVDSISKEVILFLVAVLTNPRTKRHMHEQSDEGDGLSVMDIDHDD